MTTSTLARTPVLAALVEPLEASAAGGEWGRRCTRSSGSRGC